MPGWLCYATVHTLDYASTTKILNVYPRYPSTCLGTFLAEYLLPPPAASFLSMAAHLLKYRLAAHQRLIVVWASVTG